MFKPKLKCEPEVYDALEELAETLAILIRMSQNYSEEAGEHLDKALKAINNLNVGAGE